MALHTLSVLVENSPGVLARVASLFSRRGYNIDSLAVGPTENPTISRMTIVLNLEGHALDQVSAQLFKLVNVIGIAEMREESSLQKELLLVKVSRSVDIEKVLAQYGAKISDQSSDTVTIEAVGNKSELESLLSALSKFGIKELVQSGLIALEHGSATLADRTLNTSGIATSDPESATADYQN